MEGRRRFSSPGLTAHRGIKFKTTAAILAVVLYSVQCLLSYNTCQGIQLLQSDRFSWLLHLPGTIELAGSKSRGSSYWPGKFILASVVNWIFLLTLAGESLLFPVYTVAIKCGITFLSPNFVKFGYVMKSWKIKNFVLCRNFLKCFLSLINDYKEEKKILIWCHFLTLI